MTTRESPLVGTLSSADRAHREAFWAYVLDQAEPWHRRHLTRLFEVWEQGNAKWYDGALVPPIILLAETSEPKGYGQCYSVSSYGAKSEIRIRPSLLEGTHPHIHGQVHQWQQEVTGQVEDSYHGHGPTFRDKANQISNDLGLGWVRTMKRRGPDAGLESCSQWPHCVRPSDHYLGAYVPPSGDTLDPEQVAGHLAARYPVEVLRRALELAEETER
jgi:hypothetical protein